MLNQKLSLVRRFIAFSQLNTYFFHSIAESGAVLPLKSAGQIDRGDGATLTITTLEKGRMQNVDPVIETGLSNAPGPSSAQQIVISGLDTANTAGEMVDSAGGIDDISSEVDGMVKFLSSPEQLERIISTVDKFVSLGTQVASVSVGACKNCSMECLTDDLEQIHPLLSLAWQAAQALHKVIIFQTFFVLYCANETRRS